MSKCFVLFIVLSVLLSSCSIDDEINKMTVDLGILDCKIIDVESGDVLSGMNIVINDGLIIDITESYTDNYDFKSTISANGMHITPGFMNLHMHIQNNTSQLKNWASAGVTTVRSLADFNDCILTQNKALYNSDNTNATLFTSSPIITRPGGYGHYYIDSVEEAIKAVEYHVEKGVDIIKISIEDYIQGKSFNMLNLEEIKAITKTAHELGLKVTAHVSNAHNIPLVVDGNVDEINHMIRDHVSDEDIELLVSRKVIWIPTMELWKGVSDKLNLAYYKVAKDNLKRFYEAGGIVVLGTDWGGYTIEFDDGFPITEVLAYKEAGMSSIDIIRAGTMNSAISLGIYDSVGSIAKGKKADLIISPDNPIKNIETLQEPVYVIHNGEIIFDKSSEIK